MGRALKYILAVTVVMALGTVAVEYTRKAPAGHDVLYWSDDIKPQYAETDGVNLRYVKTGSGRDVLLLHTLRTQLDMYQKIIPVLAENYTVYALDYPGHGFSDIPDAKYDADFFRKHVTAFIQEKGISGAIVVGESIGASLALQLAGQGHPGVGAVVAVNPYDYANGRGLARSSLLARFISVTASIPVMGEIVLAMRNQFITNNVFLGGVHDDMEFPEELLDLLYAINNRDGYSNMFLTLLRNSESWVQAKSLYSDTDIPAMVLWGNDDWSTPAEREASTSSLPRAVVITLPDVGHFMTVDAPAAIIDAVYAVNAMQFIEEI